MKKLKFLMLALVLGLTACGDDTYNTVTTDPKLKSAPRTEVYRDGFMETYTFIAPYEVKFLNYYQVVKSDDNTVEKYCFATDDEHVFIIEHAARAIPPFTVLCARGTAANMSGLVDDDVISLNENEVTVCFTSVVPNRWIKIKLEKQEVSVK